MSSPAASRSRATRRPVRSTARITACACSGQGPHLHHHPGGPAPAGDRAQVPQGRAEPDSADGERRRGARGAAGVLGQHAADAHSVRLRRARLRRRDAAGAGGDRRAAARSPTPGRWPRRNWCSRATSTPRSLTSEEDSGQDGVKGMMPEAGGYMGRAWKVWEFQRHRDHPPPRLRLLVPARRQRRDHQPDGAAGRGVDLRRLPPHQPARVRYLPGAAGHARLPRRR